MSSLLAAHRGHMQIYRSLVRASRTHACQEQQSL